MVRPVCDLQVLVKCQEDGIGQNKGLVGALGVTKELELDGGAAVFGVDDDLEDTRANLEVLSLASVSGAFGF